MASSGVGCGGGAGHLPRKQSFFVPQNDKFGYIFPQFLTGRKHGSLETRILQFNREITKLTKQCKNYPKIHGQKTRKCGPTIPPLIMPLLVPTSAEALYVRVRTLALCVFPETHFT